MSKKSTWEREVFGLVPLKYAEEAKRELVDWCKGNEETFERYLDGEFPDDFVKMVFRDILLGTVSKYRDKARRELQMTLEEFEIIFWERYKRYQKSLRDGEGKDDN